MSWHELPLSHCCLYIQRGKSPKYSDSGKVKIVNQKCIRWTAFELEWAKAWDDAAIGSLERTRYLIAGDVLINSTGEGTIGRANVWESSDFNWVVDSHVTVVRTNPRILNSWWLKYWLESPAGQEFIVQSKVGGTKQTELGAGKVKTTKIPLPTLDEQHRIIARIKECMERADEIEALRSESMQERNYLLESLVEAAYQDAKGEKVSLSEVCSITSRLVDPMVPQFIDLIHVGGANIEAKTGKLFDMKTAREEKLKSSKFVFDSSMILYNKIRPYLMKVARPDFSGLCSADMYPLAPNSKRLTRDYLFYLLLSRNFTDYAIAGSNRAGMPKVNRDYLFAYKFTLPSVKIQQSITETLDAAVSAVDGLRTEMKATAVEARSLRESILRKAFAGEL